MAIDLRAPNPPWLEFISSSTTPPTKITAEEKLRNKLAFYRPLPLHRKRPDDTVDFLTKFLNFLPTTEGKNNLAHAVHLCADDSELRDLADNLDDNLLRPLKAKGGRPKKKGSTSSYSRQTSDCAMDTSDPASALSEKSSATSSPLSGKISVLPLPAATAGKSKEKLLPKLLEQEAQKSQPAVRDQEALRFNCLKRDGNKCVILGAWEIHYALDHPDECQGVNTHLVAAHIIPFSLGTAKGTAKEQQALIWDFLFRCFPPVRDLFVKNRHVNCIENVMMIAESLHTPFGDFSLTLEATGTLNKYRVNKDFPRLPSLYKEHIPDTVALASTHPEDLPVPHKDLLSLHAAIANILHATGRGEQIDKIIDDLGDSGYGLSADGSTNVADLLSVSRLCLLAISPSRPSSISEE